MERETVQLRNDDACHHTRCLRELHHFPDAAIRRLFELQHDPESEAVRAAATNTLAEMLSLETSIEDEPGLVFGEQHLSTYEPL